MIGAHKAAFEHDWRARFGKPLSVVGESMTYGEAYRLTHVLSNDPSSAIAASVAGWSHPVSREAIVLMDLYDLTHQAAWAQGGGKGRRPKPYPRPWPDRVKKTLTPSVTQDEVIAALRFAGHTAPVPTI